MLSKKNILLIIHLDYSNFNILVLISDMHWVMLVYVSNTTSTNFKDVFSSLDCEIIRYQAENRSIKKYFKGSHNYATIFYLFWDVVFTGIRSKWWESWE